jgi:ubiquinone/menaquinone biosynthesis C-methylase UbiE
MNPDSSPFADGSLYDILFDSFDYCIDFYQSQAPPGIGPVLDIGCGTGRITLPLLEAGLPVDGLDLAPSMLEQLRLKAKTLDQYQPTLTVGDMARFQLQKKYSRIFITFNAFVHNLTQDDQLNCLRTCREHLQPGGKLVFDTFFPGLHIIAAEQNTRVLELEKPHPTTGRLLRLYDTRSFDRVKQVQHSINEIEEVQADGTIRILQRSEFDTRWVYREEMALLLRVAGFADWKIEGDFAGKPLTEETDAMVVTAW